MREIVLDTETTGLEPSEGHRLTEIGCLELINHLPTGRTFHTYLNPEREIDAEAAAVTGHTTEMLRDKPKFDEIADDFLDFLGTAPLVIHNASFDMGFLNAELERANRPPLPFERAVDTLRIARRKFPGSPASLDALCKRFNIDNSSRTLHGALLDSELLAEVYLELIGGRQPELVSAGGVDQSGDEDDEPGLVRHAAQKQRPQALPSRLSEAEKQAHRAFVEAELGGNAVWTK